MICRYFNDSPLFPTLAEGTEPSKPSRCSALTRNIGIGGVHSVLLLRCSHLHGLPQIGWGLVAREQRSGGGGAAAQRTVCLWVLGKRGFAPETMRPHGWNNLNVSLPDQPTSLSFALSPPSALCRAHV